MEFGTKPCKKLIVILEFQIINKEMVGSYMILLCLYSSRSIIASAHNDPCFILNHVQII